MMERVRLGRQVTAGQGDTEVFLWRRDWLRALSKTCDALLSPQTTFSFTYERFFLREEAKILQGVY